MKGQMWDFLEGITSEWPTPIKREDEETWREVYKLFRQFPASRSGFAAMNSLGRRASCSAFSSAGSSAAATQVRHLSGVLIIREALEAVC
jgi:hypothetical protein